MWRFIEILPLVVKGILKHKTLNKTHTNVDQET